MSLFFWSHVWLVGRTGMDDLWFMSVFVQNVFGIVEYVLYSNVCYVAMCVI